MGPFADKHAQNLTPDQLDAFEQLLEEPDHDIYDWFVGRQPTPPQFDDLLAMLRGNHGA